LHWGVAGLAISSAFSCVIVFVGYALKLKKCFSALPSDGKEKMSLSLMKPALPYALPNSFQQASMYLVGFLISPLVNNMGVEATASYAVVMRIFNLIASVYQNSSKCVSNYVAQCVGAKEVGKIKKSVFVGLLQNVLFSLPFLLTTILFYKSVCGLFFKADASALTKQYTYDFVRRYLPFIFFNIVCNLFHGFYRGAKANAHLFFMTLFASIVQYVCALSLIPSMGMYGFYLAWVISWIAEAIVNVVLFLLGKWMPKVEA
jgi:Na+-driven multidrug efflux pump